VDRDGHEDRVYGGQNSADRQDRQFSAVNIFRIVNGKVVEIWNHRDDLALMQQLDAPILRGSHRSFIIRARNGTRHSEKRDDLPNMPLLMMGQIG
jgi:SnoaL-like polyketide cyclase